MKPNKRIEKIESNLTPRQAALIWLKETNKHANIKDYIKSMRGVPEEMRPIPRLTRQVGDAVKDALKGQHKDVINRAVRRAHRDVIFLIKLQHHINAHFLVEERVWCGLLAALMEKYEALTWQKLYIDYVKRTARAASREMPYPVDPDMGAAVSAAIKNHVTTWEELSEQEILHDWLRDHLLANGAIELPEESYEFDDEGKCSPQIDEDNEKEVRACFKNEAEFELFKSGNDFTKGLAGIKDAEYNRHYDLMVGEMEKLVESAEVKAGTSLFLESMLVPYLMNIPLVEGKWLDRYVVELAELSALLESKGCQIDYKNDDHLLAWPVITDKDGKEITPEELVSLKKKFSLFLKKYQGRTKTIAGRLYLNFKDYSLWKGRGVTGELATLLCPGFATASWNAWLGRQKGQATLAGVPTYPISCYVTEQDYHGYQAGLAEKLLQRSSVLSNASFATSSFERQTRTWKHMAETFLTVLYKFQGTLTAIKKNYFQGEEVLFFDMARSLTELIKYAEKQVIEFNQEFAGEPENQIDAESVRRGIAKAIPGEVANLIILAKADALDHMGEDLACLELLENLVIDDTS